MGENERDWNQWDMDNHVFREVMGERKQRPGCLGNFSSIIVEEVVKAQLQQSGYLGQGMMGQEIPPVAMFRIKPQRQR